MGSFPLSPVLNQPQSYDHAVCGLFEACVDTTSFVAAKSYFFFVFVSRREVPEEINSVKQFSSELIVEAVVRCIRVIDPGLSSTLATSLPPGMSARFRVGMSLAQACQVRYLNGTVVPCYHWLNPVRQLAVFRHKHCKQLST